MLTIRRHADRSTDGPPWPLAGVSIIGELPEMHRWSTRMVDRAVTEGWMTLGRGRITVHTMSGDIVWRIVRAPGAYCVHCGCEVGGGPAGSPDEVARRRLHTDECCDDGGHPAEHPAGYEVLSGWEVELEEDRRG